MNMVKSIKLVLQCLRDRCMLNPQATFLYAPHAEQGFFCFTKKAIDKMGINVDTGMYLEKQANYSRTQVLRKENPSTSIDSMQARCCCANNFHSADTADGNLPNRIPTSTCTRLDVLLVSTSAAHAHAGHLTPVKSIQTSRPLFLRHRRTLNTESANV
jgi:hypothetical protein